MDSRHPPAKRPKAKRAFRQVDKKPVALRRSPRREAAIVSAKASGNNASARIEEDSTRGAASGKGASTSPSSLEGDLQARIRELIKLAKEQGYLTFDDLNEALPEGITDADDLDAILTRLRRM
jgi:RNA polymerase primary sigma factor